MRSPLVLSATSLSCSWFAVVAGVSIFRREEVPSLTYTLLRLYGGLSFYYYKVIKEVSIMSINDRGPAINKFSDDHLYKLGGHLFAQIWDQYVASTGLTDDLPARDEFALLGSKHLTILSKKHQDMPLADVLDLMFQEFDDYEKEHLNKCFYQS